MCVVIKRVKRFRCVLRCTVYALRWGHCGCVHVHMLHYRPTVWNWCILSKIGRHQLICLIANIHLIYELMASTQSFFAFWSIKVGNKKNGICALRSFPTNVWLTKQRNSINVHSAMMNKTRNHIYICKRFHLFGRTIFQFRCFNFTFSVPLCARLNCGTIAVSAYGPISIIRISCSVCTSACFARSSLRQLLFFPLFCFLSITISFSLSSSFFLLILSRFEVEYLFIVHSRKMIRKLMHIQFK